MGGCRDDECVSPRHNSIIPLADSALSVNLFFGLDATGLDVSPSFHPQLGPIIFLLFGTLSSTLLITILVAILSNIYSSQDAQEEAYFFRAVQTFEGVKSDAIFQFPIPVNILALLVLLPASKFLSERALHRTHVFITRVVRSSS